MKFRNLFNKITSKLKSKAFVAAAVVAVGLGAGVGMVQAEYYPARQPYDYNVPCDPTDDNKYDRCGSLEGPEFNSFINTPSYGDERSFVDGRRTDVTDRYRNVVDYVNEGPQEVEIRAYVHNNANQSTNASGLGIAEETTVRFDLPEAEGNVLRARGYISAKNASQVEDTVDFRGSGDFTVEYIPGSAKLTNLGPFKNGVQLSDDIVTTGAKIGYDKLDGNLPGCFDYHGVVTIRVKINPVVNEQPDITLNKMVRKVGQAEWKKEVNAKPGDKVEWILVSEIKGTGEMDEIVVRDQPAPQTTLVPGTVARTNPIGSANWQDGPLFDGGYQLKDTYQAGTWFYVRYDSTVQGDFEGCEARVRNQAFVRSAQHPQELKSTADVIITKDNCEEVEKKVTCDSLDAHKLTLKPGESTTLTANATPTNTTITGYAFRVNGEEVQNSGSNEYVFTSNEQGSYIIDVTVNYDGGSVTSPECVQTIDVEEEVSPKYRCESLEVNKLTFNKGEEVEVAVRITAKDGAEFKLATINFGDDSDAFVTNSAENNVVRATHSYSEAGTYTISATIEFDVNGETKTVSDEDCVAEVEVEEEEEEFCPIPGKEHLPVDSPDCETPKIPETGAGSTIGMLVAVTMLGAFTHRTLTLRRQ